jgi:SSS family solute:Na+ symporter
MHPHEESAMAKIVSLVVKFGALAFVLFLPTPYAIEMQLLGGIWTCQLVPSIVFGVFTRWFNPWALLAGWAAGMTAGTAMAASLGLKSSVYPLHLPAWLGGTYAMYAAVPALLLNLAVSAALTLLFRTFNISHGTDSTDASAYFG